MMNKPPHDIMLEEEIKKKFPDTQREDVATPIPENELDDCKNMNRKQRRKWLAKQRKKNAS